MRSGHIQMIHKGFCGIINISKCLGKVSDFMTNSKKQIEREIQEKIKKLDDAMSQEGTPLTNEIK